MLLSSSDDHRERMLTRTNVRSVTQRNVFARFAIAAALHILLQKAHERILERGQGDSILRPLWSGNRRHDRVEIQFDQSAVFDLAFLWHAEQALRFEVIADGIHVIVLATGRR